MLNEKYSVTIYFEGTIDYEVEADCETEAKVKAEELFREEDSRIIQSNILNQKIIGCEK